LSLPQISKLTNFPECSIRYRFKKEKIRLRSISEGTKLAMRRDDVINKISKTWFKKGYRISTKKQFKKGSIPWNKGKQWPAEFKKKQSIRTKQMIKNNPELLKRMLTFARPNKTRSFVSKILP
jgi:hypothetical protein